MDDRTFTVAHLAADVESKASAILFAACRILGAGCGILFIGKAVAIVAGY